MNELMALYLVLLTPSSLPPLLWGPPGIGKSQRIKQLGKAMKMMVEIVIASIREPQDFSGLPMPDDEGGVRLAAPIWAKRAHKEGRALIFHDEISCTPPATQAALLRVIHEGVIGELQLPEGVKQVGAANPPDQAAGGWDLALPLANRFVHLVWGSPTVKGWTDWLLGNDEGMSLPQFDMSGWDKCFSKAKSLVSGFMRKFPDLLSEDPAKIQGRFPMAYGTPRTWESATRIYATVLCTGQSSVALQLIAGCVGEPAATKFFAWVREADLPDPEDLLKNPTSYKPDRSRPDAVFATLNAVVYAAIEKHPAPVYLDRWKAAWQVLERAMDLGKDLVVVAARKLATEANRPKNGFKEPIVVKVVSQLRDVVKESGLME